MRWLLAVVALAVAGCATTVPIQSASPVPKGTWRVGGEASIAPWCTVTLSPQRCSRTPGVVPQLRGTARTGLSDRVDLGLSAHLRHQVSSGPQVGALVDAKVRLWRQDAGEDREWLVSLGGGLGTTLGLGQYDRPGMTQVDGALPLFAAYRAGGHEFLVSPRAVMRVQFFDLDGDGRREPLPVAEAGLAFAWIMGRGPFRFGLQLEYQAPVDLPLGGPWTLGASGSWDIVPGE